MKMKWSLLPLILGAININSFADTLPTAQTYAMGVQMRGVNLSGAEFNNRTWVMSGAATPTLYDAALFLYKGMNTYRIPVLWEYLSDRADGSLDTETPYFKNLKTTIAALTAKGAYVVLDLHNYMRYNPTDVSQDYDANNNNIIGTANGPTTAAYAQLWGNLAKQFPDSHVLYDLMNEPHDVDSAVVVGSQNAAIKAIRTTEHDGGIVPHWILLEGNYWSGMHSWFDSSQGVANSEAYARNQINDPANHYAIEVHQYLDENASGQYPTGDCIDASVFNSKFQLYFTAFQKWVEQNQIPVFLGEVGAPDTSNCRADLAKVLSAMNSNAYKDDGHEFGFLGWTVWSAGHAWGNYKLSIAPGAPANGLMWNNALYENYLIAAAPLPAAPPVIAQVTNASGSDLQLSGFWPFQIQGGSPVIKNNETINLYSDNSDATLIPNQTRELVFNFANNSSLIAGAGVGNDGWGYHYSNAGSGLQVVTNDAQQCAIKPSNGDKQRCQTIKLA